MINRISPVVTLDQAAALMRPHRSKSIRLDRIWPPNETTGLLSQIGGRPNLPPDWVWPTIDFEDGTTASLDFLAQINLEELPDIEARGALPKSGMLYFFALSQSNEPLESYGSDAWRVLYYPDNPADLPSRPAPEDAGWKIDHLDYGQTDASSYRNPDGPRGELFPRCTVRFTVIDVWDLPRFSGRDDPRLRPFEDAICGEPADLDKPAGIADVIRTFWKDMNPFKPKTSKAPEPPRKEAPQARADIEMRDIDSLAYDCLQMLCVEEQRDFYQSRVELNPESLPYRAEDAVMVLNEARNTWFENILPIETVLDHEGKYSDALLQAYNDWRAQAVALTHNLVAMGRETRLSPEDRGKVLDVLEQNVRLQKQARQYASHPHLEFTLRASLTTLLSDFPGIAEKEPELLAVGDPDNRVELNGFLSHRMFGNGKGIQEDLDDDEVLLLQLCSDSDGPRFMWWDVGAIRFWIKREALETCQFHLVEAEIEGH
ncbi:MULTISPECIES: DUF1963 domain-containing protein [Rhizobium]|jgi:uncharacterized protein YwqG|uniref:DUF1963 domain-containing protein n=1 Tax=Rhizobium TaxID=379 RepID=UPI000B1BA6E8|nr:MULTISPECIES: DUF1963 domain-containing protein [Rhizobium]MDV4157651.1 DUF1963 domain-containing protein [Rhizobium brockwellii]